MFIDLSDNKTKKYFKNALDVRICDDGSAWPVRFSDKLFSVYGTKENRRIRSCCPSGICINLITDSDFLNLDVNILSFARDFAYFDLYIDNVFVDTQGGEPVRDINGKISFNLAYRHINGKCKGDGKKQRITIYLPHLVDIRIVSIEVQDGCIIEDCNNITEQQKTILCLGDSITQGMTAKRPSSIYPVQLARKLGMNLINHGVGGFVYDKDVLDEDLNINPDIITIAYGVNDWNRYDSIEIFKEMCQDFFKKLVIVYPKAKIYVITPLWCSRENEKKETGYLSDIRREIERIAGNFERIHILNGLEVVPNMQECFFDGTHPNDLGFMHYSLNLLRECQTLTLMKSV